jgi:hypothetical protein
LHGNSIVNITVVGLVQGRFHCQRPRRLVTPPHRDCPSAYEQDLKDSDGTSQFMEQFARFPDGAAVAFKPGVAPSPAPPVERRSPDRPDRRKHSRSGRRAQDPHTSWRRVYLLFGAYAVYLSLRKLPSTFRRLLRRETVSQ